MGPFGRATAVVLPALLVTSLLAGCDDEAGATGGDRVGLVVAATSGSWSSELSDGFRAGVRQVPGVTPVVTGPRVVDGPDELRQFSALRRSEPAGMSVFTLEPEIFAGEVRATVEEGVPIVALDSPPAAGTGARLLIGNDDHELGTMLVDAVIARLPAEIRAGRRGGTVVIGTSAPGSQVLDRRAAGIQERFAARLPLLEVLGPFDTKSEAESNLSAWRLLVEAAPGAVAYLGTGEVDAYNLATVRHETNGSWAAGGFDVDARTLNAVRNGELVVVSPESYVKGAVAGRLLAQHAAGGEPLPQGWIRIAGVVVDRDDVDRMVARQSSTLARAEFFRATVDRLVERARDGDLPALP